MAVMLGNRWKQLWEIEKMKKAGDDEASRVNGGRESQGTD